MFRNDAKALYHHMLAIWPAAGNHGPATVLAWVDYLADLPETDAQQSVADAKLGCDFFPSFAEFNRLVVDGRERRAVAERPRPVAAIEAGEPYNPEAVKRFAALGRQLLKENRETITAKQLDEAGVKHWRERLSSARVRDEVEHRYGHEYDKAWSEIRAEYRAMAK